MGLIARGVEESGIPTVLLGSCLDIMKQLTAPRTVFLDYPLGRQCGPPNDKEQQLRILKDSLSLLETAEKPGQLLELPYKWKEPFDWDSYNRDVDQMIKEEGIVPQDWKKDG